jgi:putative transposase
LTGPIRGTRVPGEVKLKIVRAVYLAKAEGFPIQRSCELIMLDARRLRRWVQRAQISQGSGSGPVRKAAPGALQRPGSEQISAEDLADRPPVAKVVPHRLTDAERDEIIRAADEQGLGELRHRKLTHQLSRHGRLFCSESSVLRVLRAAGKVPRYMRPRRPQMTRSQARPSVPNDAWDYDFTFLPTIAGTYHLVPVIDRCSRKILGRYFGPEQTSSAVHTAWGKALANEGLLGEGGPPLPSAHSDRGTQMTSRSTRAFFAELGITQTFSRARTPNDNATCESWMATLKCERLYDADTAQMSPWEVEAMIDRFIDYYNNERLHQGLGYVTPADRHEGRHEAILTARTEGMTRAKQRRKMEAYGGTGANR